MSLPYSICIETLFGEAGPAEARVRAAAAAGFDAVELWNWSSKDLDVLDETFRTTGVALKAMACEPRASLVDPTSHPAWLEGVSRSLDVARRLRAEALVVHSGVSRIGVPRDEQRDALALALSDAAARVAGSKVRLLLEPLNTRIDHPATFLDHTRDALAVVDAVGRPEVRLLYDVYHSVTMGETPQRVLAGRVDRVGHLHLADVPGRHEPGSGGLPWRGILDWLEAQGYHGHVGLEYWPTQGTLGSLRSFIDTTGSNRRIS
ncbi:MAG: TIM barrel protein [Deinococcales bacterium]